MVKKTIIFDAQLFQTSAKFRGMGHYISALLNAMVRTDNANIVILYSTELEGVIDTHELGSLLDTQINHSNFVGLPLVGDNVYKDSSKGMATNKKIVEEWISSSGIENPVYIIGSLFQFEIYPAFPSNAIKAAIMYDLIPLQHFNEYESKMRWDDYLQRFRLVYEADILMCISKTTANDLQIYCSVSSEKIVVIDGGPGKFEESKKNISVKGKFILMPTGNDIRKNNERAVSAFERFNNARDYEYSLVITSFFSEEEKARYNDLAQNIIFTDTISNEEMAWCYKNSEALLYPSLYEGLGMPLIEAALFDKPIAASYIDVFIEILPEGCYYFNPLDEADIESALNLVIDIGVTNKIKQKYKDVIGKYTWENSAESVFESIRNFKNVTVTTAKKKVAIVGPHYTGVSAIGKYIGELHQEMISKFDVDYYFERSPIDRDLRANLLGSVSNYYPISELTNHKLKQYETVIYNIGNSNHHTITTAKALTNPGIIILHDLNVENVYKDMQSRNLIDSARFNIERSLTEKYTKKASFAFSVLNRQSTVIVHSEYGKKIASDLVQNGSSDVVHLSLPIDTPKYKIEHKNEVFTIGMAGIIAGIKGVEVIEKIAKSSHFANDRVRLFGLNFAEPGLLDRLMRLPNVEILTNLSDYEFQQNLKKLDVFVNYRKKYQGEASQATLEAMRYGVPVIVRSDFGWYSELPEDTVIKVSDESQVIPALVEFRADAKRRAEISLKASECTRKMFNQEDYVNGIYKIINRGMGNEDLR